MFYPGGWFKTGDVVTLDAVADNFQPDVIVHQATALGEARFSRNFDRTAQNPRCAYFGNVRVGDDITVVSCVDHPSLPGQ